MPGTLIPVSDEEKLFSDPPDYALLFSWHIAEELIPKFRKSGYRGKFIEERPGIDGRSLTPVQMACTKEVR
jgi:hypothetical protein